MEITKDFALLYGILLGDGCLSKVKRKDGKNSFHYLIVITCSYYDDQEFIHNVVLPLLEKIRGRKTKVCNYRNDGTIRLMFSDKELYYFLRNLDFPRGVKGDRVIIPEIFYDNCLVRQVIQGYFATDGCFCLTKNPKKYYPRIESATTNLNVLGQIHKYLNSIGMDGSIRRVKRIKKYWKTQKSQFHIQFNGHDNLEIFRKKIGFVNYKHKKKYLNFQNYLKIYEVGKEIDYDFNMALPGIEPGTFCA
jgi:intein/homing endonuclease